MQRPVHAVSSMIGDVNELPNRAAGDDPNVAVIGAGAALCVGVVLVALRWITGVEIGGPGLVLVCAGGAWFVGTRLAVTAYENSHFDKVTSGAMEPRLITVGVETVHGVWAISVDGQAPVPSALCEEEAEAVIVDTANLCMASPRRLRRRPRLDANLWRPLQTGTVRTTGEALELVAAAVNQHKANGSGHSRR